MLRMLRLTWQSRFDPDIQRKVRHAASVEALRTLDSK
jgi:hypothetical protein